MSADSDRLRWPQGIDARRFLAEFWQRRPLLMRAALPGIASPLDADELAGLACEPEVESRIIQEGGADGRWHVSHGPFDAADFAALPDSHWTLLVQDADKHVPQVAELLARFDFLPEWRLDDIMISWAEDQGSVGPHLDEYDVFLIQVEGRRRWRIDDRPDPNRAILPDLDLRILEHFSPDQDWLLEPGDMLYLPPGVPHWGIAEGPCMTWSVGLRAPPWRELAADWLQELVDSHGDDRLWRDPPRSRPPAEPAALPAELADAVAAYVRDLLSRGSRPELEHWLGTVLTEPKPNLALLPPEPPWPAEEVLALLRERGRLTRDGTSRLLYRRAPEDASGASADLLFANGVCHSLPAGGADFLAALCRRPALTAEAAAPWLRDADCVSLLTTLFNAGHFIADED
jgi:50S ribosomal protein L16 3-hydroxylase